MEYYVCTSKWLNNICSSKGSLTIIKRWFHLSSPRHTVFCRWLLRTSQRWLSPVRSSVCCTKNWPNKILMVLAMFELWQKNVPYQSFGHDKIVWSLLAWLRISLACHYSIAHVLWPTCGQAKPLSLPSDSALCVVLCALHALVVEYNGFIWS